LKSDKVGKLLPQPSKLQVTRLSSVIEGEGVMTKAWSSSLAVILRPTGSVACPNGAAATPEPFWRLGLGVLIDAGVLVVVWVAFNVAANATAAIV
jgi:hypothetical protein